MPISTYIPPTFGNFGKNSLFQVYDKDSLDHTLTLKTKTPTGVATEAGLVYAPKANPRGHVKTSFGLRGYTVAATFQTDASKVSQVGVAGKNLLPKVLPGLNGAFTVTSSEKDLPGKAKYGAFDTVALDYARGNFAATVGATSDLDSQHSVSASAAVGFEGFSLGGDVKLVKQGASAFVAKSYNAGVAYSYKNYTAAAVSDAKFEKVKLTAIATNFRGVTGVTIGAQAKLDVQAPASGAPQRELIVSIEQKASAQTTYKLAAVVTNGQILMGVEHRLANPAVTLTATGVTALPNSTFAPFAFQKFGVGLTFEA